MTIRTRKPTGQVPYPLILLEGPEGAGKSLAPVVLSRSPRVGMTYWFDLGEGAADEYAALQGSEYLVVEHTGAYQDILEQLTEVWNEADRAAKADEPPVVVVVDSMSALWTMLVNWTNARARRSKTGQRALAEDADAEVDPTSNLWNDANKRWARVMDLLMRFPGIAIVTARGKEVAIGKDGKPLPRPEWKVEGQKMLAYDVTAWVRLQREPRSADLIKVKSLNVNVPKNRPMPMPTTEIGEWDVVDLETFIFEDMGCVGGAVRDLQPLRGDELETAYDDIAQAPTEEDLRAIWDRVKPSLTPDQYADVMAAVTARLEALRGHVTPDKPSSDTEPQLDAHGPASDAERLRQAAEARAASGEPNTGHEERGERDGGGES